MWLALYGFLKPVLTLKNIGILLLVLTLVGGVLWYGNKREAAGYQAGSVSQLQDDKKQFTSLVQEYSKALADKDKQIDTQDKIVSSLQTQVSALSTQYAALAAQRTQQKQNVDKIPDSQIQADLEAKLGGPLSSPFILHKADDIVTDYPLVLKQLDVDGQAISKLSDEVQAINKKVDLITSQRDSAISFGNTVVGYYTKAYNAAQVHHSRFVKIITFGLVHDKHMDLPNPVTIKP